MARYIDTDKLIEQFKERHGNRSEYLKIYTLSEIINVIDQQSATDVQEVKHGCWINKPLSGYSYCRCSNCRKITEIFVSRYKVATQKYCPNCGAKMDLEEDEE